MSYCFPYPQNSDVVPLRAPYIATTQHTFSGSSSFLKSFKDALARETRQCTNENGTPGTGSTPTQPQRKFASFIQSWLFFGLASEALLEDVEHTRFTEANAVGSAELSIDIRIPQWFWTRLNLRWMALKKLLRTDAYKISEEDIKVCIRFTKKALEDLDLDTGADTELRAVILSVHMLLYVLSAHFGDITVSLSSIDSTSTKALVQRMVDNGWCRKRLNFINVYQMFYPVLYFLSSFRPPHGKNDNHRSCTMAKCAVATGLLEPLHRSTDCQCENINVPVDQVCKIVASNDIPLIRIIRSSSGKINLQVVPYNGKNRFIAVSHVWADRQFGSATNGLPKCQIEYLDNVLATLPGNGFSWHMREWCYKKWSPPGRDDDNLVPRTRAWPLFWLDSFCIPQAPQYNELKHRAIDFMNLIYAAASQTLVFDSSLQNFNAGKQPMQLFDIGPPTYYGPQRRNVQDLFAHICASNWMGRAWTLQEGVLSSDLVFPLNGSTAYLRVLWNYVESRTSFADAWLFRIKPARKFLTQHDEAGSVVDRVTYFSGTSEPFRNRISSELHVFLTASLNVDEYSDYAREPADQTARFVNSHSLLQSRSTTQPDDLPLILVNMSGMNGNLVARAKGTENKMKLLFYGLGILPVELLFSECPRIGSREVDSWIPRHVVPEVFSGNHTLRLQPDGFHFHYGDNCRPLKFFMLPSSTNWHKDIQLKATDDIGLVLKALEPSNKELTLTSKNGWCILLEDQQPLRSPRAALFVVSGLEENKVFLHFERSARLSTLKFGNNEIEEHLPTHVYQPAEEKLEFIIEKGSTPQDLRMPRPQTRKQYSDRLIFTGDMLSKVLIFGHQYFCRHFLEKALRNNIPLCVLYGLFTLTIRISMERALKALVHRAWIETFYPEWNPNGRWKWFWKLLNYVPPVPFKKMMKYYLKLMLSVTLTLGMHSLSAAASLYWYAIYPKEELVALYLIIFFLRGLDWVFGIF